MKRLRHTLFGMNLLFSFSVGITIFINSSFITASISERAVGIIYAASAALSIYILSRASYKLARVGGKRFFIIYAALEAASLVCLIVPGPILFHIIALTVYLAAVSVLIFSFDVLFRNSFPEKNMGQNRGLFLLLGNLGVMLAPLCTAYLVQHFGYQGSYAAALLIIVIVIASVFFRMENYVDIKHTPHPVRVMLKRAFSRPALRNVIIAHFLLQFFYAWMVVYSPIFLHTHLGYSWNTIGTIFAVMLSAFVILDYPLGRLADYLGSEKELAAIGFIFMFGAVFSLAFLPLTNVFFVGAVFFISRIGAATVEAMTEIHFFKVSDDATLSSIFRDIRPFAYMVAPLLGALVLSFLPIQYIFGILAIIMLIGFSVSAHIERGPRWWVKAHRN